MNKKARVKARNQNHYGQSTLQWSQGDPLELFERMVGDVEADMRLVRAKDIAAEVLRSDLDTEDDEVPVALIEPIRNGVVEHGDGTYDIRIAIATKMGLPLAGSFGPCLAPGWIFGPRQGKWELTDPTATLIARCDVAAEDSVGEAAWTAQAVAAGRVVIAYGARVGVRVPDGVPPSQYNDLYRAAELRKSLTGRQACAAIVRLSPQIGAFRRSRSS
jgi:hypothetical protein